MAQPKETDEQQAASQKAQLYSWAGVACLFVVPVVIVCGDSLDSLVRSWLGLPREAATLVLIVFLVSWVLGFAGCLWRAGEWGLRSKAHTEAQRAALPELVSLYRWRTALWVIAVAMNLAVQPAASWGRAAHIPWLVTAVGILALMSLPFVSIYFLEKRSKRIWEAVSQSEQAKNFAILSHERRIMGE